MREILILLSLYIFSCHICAQPNSLESQYITIGVKGKSSTTKKTTDLNSKKDDSTLDGNLNNNHSYSNVIHLPGSAKEQREDKNLSKRLSIEENRARPLGIGNIESLSRVDPQKYIQELRRRYDIINMQEYQRGKNDGKIELMREKNVRENEYEYYLHITKKHGWFVGVGKPLNEEDLSHIPTYYKLSCKDEDGHWVYLQAMNSYGKLTTNHNIVTYLVNPNSTINNNGNKDINDTLQSVCQWMVVGNANKKEVAQELGLDNLGNIIYCYTPVKIGENKHVGTYTDKYGMPIYMRTDSLGNHIGYSNFVQITLDSNGYDSLLVFVDEKGYPKINKDGAYQTRKIFKSDGMQISEESLNILGERVNDDYSNCGWIAEYDEWGNNTKVEYFDANGNPYNGTVGTDSVYGYEFEYDKYHREIKRYFLDEFGKRTTNSLGVYTTEKEYDSHGNMTHYVHLNIEGHRTAGDTLGISEIYAKWDDNGNLLSRKYYNTNKEYVNNSDSICGRESEYDENNLITHNIYYCINGEKLEKRFEYKRDDNTLTQTRVWYNDNLVRKDSLYADGTRKSTEYYTLDGEKTEYSGYHKYKRYIYDTPNKSVIIAEWLDKDGEHSLADDDSDYTKYISRTDSLTHITEKEQYLYNYLRYKFGQKESEDFNTILSRWDITPYGEQARVGWWNTCVYKYDITYSLYGRVLSFVGKNEFDEPAYINRLGSDPDVYYFSNINGGKHIYYDEFGNKIDSMADFRNKLPRVHCIEVIDTLIAYPLGLRNGDIIISYGDWTIDKSLISNHKYLYLEEILKADEPKKMIVLRHYPSEHRSQLINLSLPSGKPSELGFYPHTIYYTQKEAERLHKSVKEYGLSYMDNIKGDIRMVLLNPIKGSLLSTKPYWLRKCQDPGIVVFAENCIDNEYNGIISNVDSQWDLQTNDVEDWYYSPVFAESYEGIKNIYYSTDLKTFNSQRIKGADNEGLSTHFVWVNEAIKEKLLKNYNASKDSVTYGSGELFDWKTDCKGKLSLRKFAEKVQSYKFGYGTVVKKGSKAYKEFVADNVDLTGVNYFMRWRISEDYNSDVYKLLKRLNTSQFTELNEKKHGLNYNCRLQICSYNETNATIEKLLIIDDKQIIVYEGNIDKNNIIDKFDELLNYTLEYRDEHYLQYIKMKPREGGMLSNMGYNGTYILLKYNEWCQGKSIDLLSELIDSSDQVERDLVIVPIKESSHKIKFGEPLSVHCPTGALDAYFSYTRIPAEVAQKVKSLEVDFKETDN